MRIQNSIKCDPQSYTLPFNKAKVQSPYFDIVLWMQHTFILERHILSSQHDNPESQFRSCAWSSTSFHNRTKVRFSDPFGCYLTNKSKLHRLQTTLKGNYYWASIHYYRILRLFPYSLIQSTDFDALNHNNQRFCKKYEYC